MKINKFSKILFSNILLSAVLFCIFEIIAVHCLSTYWIHSGKSLFTERLSYFFPLKKGIMEDVYNYRSAEYRQGKKLPVVLFGCSYTYGSELNENETFGYVLADYTDRTVYNKGMSGGSCASMLYLLQKPEFKKEVPQAEYFIYVYIPDHLRRVYMNSHEWFHEYMLAAYKITPNNELKCRKLNKFKLLLYSTATYRFFQSFYSRFKFSHNKIDFNLFFRIIEESVKITKNKYPDSKFVILVYDDAPEYYSLNLEEEEGQFENFARKHGIKVLYTKKMSIGRDLLSGKYRAKDNIHPSKDVWKILVPEIAEELKL